MGSTSAPTARLASPRTVIVNPPVEEDLFVTPRRQAVAALSLVLRLALWPLFLLREIIMLPRRFAAVWRSAGWDVCTGHSSIASAQHFRYCGPLRRAETGQVQQSEERVSDTLCAVIIWGLIIGLRGRSITVQICLWCLVSPTVGFTPSLTACRLVWDEAQDGSSLTCTLLSSKLGLPLGPAQRALDAVEGWFIPGHPVFLRRASVGSSAYAHLTATARL